MEEIVIVLRNYTRRQDYLYQMSSANLEGIFNVFKSPKHSKLRDKVREIFDQLSYNQTLR
jgi:hypothetical protein